MYAMTDMLISVFIIKNISVEDMSEIAIIASGLIGILSASIGGYVVSKIAFKKAENMVERLKTEAFDEFKDFMDTDEAKTFFYNVGVLIGNGAKAGFGITKGKGGKGGLTELLMQAFIPKILGNNTPSATETPNILGGMGVE